MGLGTRSQELTQLGIERRTPPPLPLPQLSTDEKLKAVLSLIATFGGYGLTLMALLLSLLSAWIACDQYFLLSSWGRADAEILNGEVYSGTIHNNAVTPTRPNSVFGFRCTVRFQANGRFYESKADIGYRKSAKAEMSDWYLRFPEGGHTTIAYDPSDPHRVKLAEDVRTSYAAPLASMQYAGWLWLLGVPLVLVSGRLRRQQQRALDSEAARASISPIA